MNGEPFTMKGTKVLTLGAGHLAIRMRYMCMHARYCYWWAGPSIFKQLVVAYHLAESQSLASYTTRYHAGVNARPALQLLVPPRYAELVEVI